MSEFNPKIVAFCCNNCAFAAADLAGNLRLSYPANVRIIRVPCTGKVDVLYLIAALEKGADGVMVVGCEEGSCHYVNGNLRARKRLEHLKQELNKIGVAEQRVEMFNLSAAQAGRFAEYCREFTQKIQKIGPVFPGETNYYPEDFQVLNF